MIQKKSMNVPDNIYEVFGLTLPFSKKEDVSSYVAGESITEFIGGQRIDTLKRESKYKTYYPRLKEFNLLTLHYPSMPENIYEKVRYIKKIIRKNILKSLTSLSPEKKANDSCLKYIRGILSLYSDSIQAERLHYGYNENHDADIAFQVLRTRDMFSLSLTEKGDAAVYADPFCSKKAGYYYLKINPSKTVHIIDLPDFLVDMLLMQTIHQIQAKIQLPVVQSIFEKYTHALSEAADMLQENYEIKALAASLVSKTPFPCTCLLHGYQHKNKEYYSVGLSWEISAKMIELFSKVLEVYQDIQYENRHRTEMGRTVATAYMTKKNIPRSTLDAMEHTAFKKYFKYVEFDEEVDLDSVKVIEEEFKVLNEAYFSGKAFFNVKLRFRKLGKHKASGLYYPSLHTLCVDLRSPASFIHEYLHMLDDQMGDLSLDMAFQDIVEEYKHAFLKNMTRLESEVQTQLNGRGKYNLQYFFRRAEIFARCGEIYFARILKVESSLIQPDLEYAYPQSGRLDNLIKNYYEELLHVKLEQSEFAKAV